MDKLQKIQMLTEAVQLLEERIRENAEDLSPGTGDETDEESLAGQLSILKGKIIRHSASAWILYIDFDYTSPADISKIHPFDVASINFLLFEASSLLPRRYGEVPWEKDYYEFRCDGNGSVDVFFESTQQTIKVPIDGEGYIGEHIILKAFSTAEAAREYRLFPDSEDEQAARLFKTNRQHIDPSWDETE